MLSLATLGHTKRQHRFQQQLKYNDYYNYDCNIILSKFF